MNWEGTYHLNAWDHGDGLDNDDEFLNSSCNSWPNQWVEKALPTQTFA